MESGTVMVIKEGDVLRISDQPYGKSVVGVVYRTGDTNQDTYWIGSNLKMTEKQSRYSGRSVSK
jgi:hypothetical protein